MAELDNNGIQILPIWARQIESARQQSETAIAALTVRFAAIVDRIDRALGSRTSGTAQDDSANDIRSNEAALRQVVDALKAIQLSRNQLAAEIRGMTAHTAELLQLASEVDNVGFRTNILSLNAAIEAAHAGESGRGFAVVAAEVRSLSNQVRETSKRITARIGAINETIRRIDTTNDEVALRDELAVTTAEGQIHEMLKRFGEGMARLQASRGDSARIRQEIGESIVHLQFQDRTSQMLCHVVANMEKLAAQELDAGGGAVPTLTEDQAADLLETYTTDEQRRAHRGLEPEAAAPQAVTFF